MWDFPITDNSNGVYYGSAWFPVKIRNFIDKRWVHKYSIWDRPIYVATYHRSLIHEDLIFYLYHAKMNLLRDVPASIFWKQTNSIMQIPEDTADVWWTGHGFIVAKHVSWNMFNVEQEDFNRIKEFRKRNSHLTSTYEMDFDELMGEWV